MILSLVLLLQGENLTLRDAVEMALRNNLSLEISRYAPLSAEQDIDRGWGTFDWFVHSNPTYTETQQPTASVLSASENKSLDMDLGLRQITPLGISYDLTSSLRRNSTNLGFATLNPSYSSSLGMEITVPTLRGLGLDGAYSTILIAQNNHSISERQFERTLIATIYDVEKAYWDLVFALEDLKVKQKSLEVAQTLLQNNRERLDAGLVARIEVTRAEADLASREEAIIVADNAAQNAMDALRSLIDPSTIREGGRDVPITPVDRPAAPSEPLDEGAALAQGLQQAMAMRPELATVEFQQKNQDLTIENAEDGSLPRFDLLASARYLGLGRHADNKMLDELFNEETHAWSVGALLEIPLGNWSAEADLLKAELERRRLNLELRRLQDQIIVELRQAVRAVKSSEKRIDAGRKSVAAAQENYEAEEARRRAGDATSFEVLSALEDYTSAQSTELRARIDYTMATLDRQRAGGMLLQERAIVLAGQLHLKQGR